MSNDRNVPPKPGSESQPRHRIPFVSRIFPETELTARLGAAGEGGMTPPAGPHGEPRVNEDDGGGAWVTCWNWYGPIAKSRMDERLAPVICDSAFFQGDVSLAFMALVPPAHPEWIRLDVLGLPESTPQFNALLHLYLWTQGSVPVGHAGHGRIGILLGYHWIPYPDEMRTAFERGEPNAYPDFTGLVDELIIRLLTGGPEVVKGMFHSVKLLD